MKKVITIGSGWSGSSAVLEYLLGRQDVHDPFNGAEFRIIGDPGGLFELHTKLKYTFSVHSGNQAIKDFINCCERNNYSLYRRREKYIKMNLVHEFINSITFIKYKGLSADEHKKLSYHKKIYGSIRKHLARKKGEKAMINTMYYPVSEKDFINKAKVFVDQLIKHNLDENDGKKVCAIDHGGTFWNPESSTHYYGDRHVLIITRDPRDIFAELKIKGNAYPTEDAKTFCMWYKDMRERVSVNEWNNSYVSIIKFEEFVNHFQDYKKKIDGILNLDNQIQSSYQPEKSAINIGKFKVHLQKEEITVIEKELEGYLHY